MGNDHKDAVVDLSKMKREQNSTSDSPPNKDNCSDNPMVVMCNESVNLIRHENSMHDDSTGRGGIDKNKDMGFFKVTMSFL